MAMPVALIAVDWGTTNRRAWALGESGSVIATRSDGAGLLSVKHGRFGESFEAFAGDWLAGQRPPVLMCGMVGSRLGWAEAPYVRTPAAAEDLGRNLHSVAFEKAEVRIVPGVSCDGKNGAPDVMRGEECQIFGLVAARGWRDACIILPGTHSKWAVVRQGSLMSFRTYMTGELFGHLKAGGTLAQVLQDGPHDSAAFKRGLERATGSLLHELFGVRTLGLFGRMEGPALTSYLSGLLIGTEFADARSLMRSDRLVAIGSPALLTHYAAAARHFGVTLDIEDSAALLPRILFTIAQSAGLMGVRIDGG